MKRKLQCTVLCLILFTSLNVLCACGQDIAPIQTSVTQFEQFCQSQDFDQILNCFSPDISEPIRSALAFYGVELNNLDALLDNLFEFVPPGSFSSLSELLPTVKITPLEYSFSEDESLCSVSSQVSVNIGSVVQDDVVVLDFVFYNGNWYISSIRSFD